MAKRSALVYCAWLFVAVLSWIAPLQAQDRPISPNLPSDPGILLLAHGGSPAWNAEVLAVAEQVNAVRPVEVAFGMATRATLQEGIDKLLARGAKRIVAVPLFISSHSSVIDSTRFLLGLRAEAPADLAMFAGMHHHSGTAEPASLGTTPVECPVPLQMAPALDRHPIVAEILLDRAKTISKEPAQETVILVAHGPNQEEENKLWLADMAALTGLMAARGPFTRFVRLTLRDDAEGAVREQATAELRTQVQSATGSGYRVLVVPLLLSFGGIEGRLRDRLSGLDYVMSPQGVLPDARIVQWVLQSALATQP